MKKTFAFVTTLILASALSSLPAVAQKAKKPAAAPRSVRVDISKDKVGAESSKFLSVVGDWSVVDDGGKKAYAVDGREWLRGNPSRSLAENARAIYGSRHEEFIDNVKAFAYFPYSVAKEISDFQDGEISVKFKMIEGKLDKCAGILFNLKPNGDYLTVRLNGKDLLDYTLAEPVSGKVGLWSKTDSVSYFDEFTVTPAPK